MLLRPTDLESFLRVDTGSPAGQMPGGMDRDTGLRRIAQTWNRAAHICAQEGIRIVWEFESAFLFNNPSDVIRMVSAKADALLSWSVPLEQTVDAIRMVQERAQGAIKVQVTP